MLKHFFKRTWEFIDDRLGISEVILPLARHGVPKDAKWWYVFGSATLVAFIIQVVSGVALAFSYVPSSADAYSSLVEITNEAPFGNFLRALHYYGASAMVLMAALHMTRVFLLGAYKYPREITWSTGVLLLGFTLVMGFTGQILRWDQNAAWSVVVAAEQAGRVPWIGDGLARLILGGQSLGGSTLGRFFVVHVFIVPGCLLTFIGIHLWLILRHGISEMPKPNETVDPKTYRKEYEERLKKSGVPFWPNAAWRDIVFATAMVVGIVILALVFGPPTLDKPPDPSIIEASPRPDWYLVWYFAVMALLPPATEQYLMVFGPLLIGLGLIAIPYLRNSGERSPSRRPWAIAAVLITYMSIGVLWLAGEKSDWSPHFDQKPLPSEVINSNDQSVIEGARLFYDKACLNCHRIEQYGGRRGPNLTRVGNLLNKDQMIIRIMNGGVNMPAYAGNIKPQEVEDLVEFLQSRKTRWRDPKSSSD